MTHKDLGQAGDWVKPAMSQRTIEVELLASGTNVHTVAKAIFNDYEAMISHRGGDLTIKEEEFINYIFTLIDARIQFVNGNAKVYNTIKHECYLPHLFATLIASIGHGLDDNTGIEVKVSNKDIFEFQALTIDELISLSLKLKRISMSLGISMATELAKSKEGNPNVLLFNSTDKGVYGRSLNDATPLAVLALMLETRPQLHEDCFAVSFIPKEIQTRVLHAISSIGNLK